MGKKTKDSETVSALLSLKTRGNAYMPSEKLLKFMETAELCFTSVHGNKLSLDKNPIERVSIIIQQAAPHIEVKIINF